MSQYGFEEEIPHHPEVPTKTREAVQERSRALAEKEREEQEDKRRSAREATQKARAQLIETLGAERYEVSRRLVEENRKERQSFLEPPKGPDRSPEALEELAQKRRALFRKEVGVDPKAVEPIFAAWREKISAISNAADDAPDNKVVPTEEVPEAIRHYKTNPWTIVRPPFRGWQRGWWSDGDGYQVNFENSVDQALGEVEVYSRLRNNDASDFDHVFSRIDAQIGFWFRSDRLGLVEAWIEGQNIQELHALHLRDEWGLSSQETNQRNHLMMHVIHPNIDRVATSRMSWYDNSRLSGFFNPSFLVEGNIYWGHVFSDGVIPANTWVWVRVGTRSTNHSWTNDVSILSSRVNFSWFIRSVQLRTTGA
jgi:hypothetical protein